ncbi:MAG TPA: single-stranded DNA-binding protein [Agromyces sp.]|nr:single-stranded DNA-binding protein [Agromyces sp.]
MTDLITVTGVVGSDPRHTVTNQGLAITSFRLASTRRYFDRAKGSWEDGETNWFTVATFRNLAVNTARSLHKGERVIVRGRLRLRAWDTGDKSGLAVEIEADAVGHDLSWGVASWQKAGPSRSADAPVTGDSDPVPASAGTGSGWPMSDDSASTAFGEEFATAGFGQAHADATGPTVDDDESASVDEESERAVVLAG